VVAFVVEFEFVLPVAVDSPTENVVVAPFPFAVFDPVASAEDPVAVWDAEAVLLLSCRLTMMESSSGNQFDHIGHAVAYAERYKMIIEYIWRVCEARIVKVGLLTTALKTRLNLDSICVNIDQILGKVS
jgi:hypothetical protein